MRIIPLAGLGILLAAAPRAGAQATCAARPGSLTPEGWTAPALPAARARGPLHVVADRPLPGSATRFDYQSVDPAGRRLYISHMGAGQLLVFNLESQRVATHVDGVARATGVLAVPAHRQVYVSAAGIPAVVAIDDRIFSIRSAIPGPKFPDGIAYAPDEGRLFVSDESGGKDYAIDAQADTVVGIVPLGGEAGNTHYDGVSHCILVAVQTRNQLVAIDPASLRIVARYDVPGVEGPHGFALDEAGRLAFVTGEDNATLALLDLRTMRVLDRYAVGSGPDVLAWDAAWRRLYVASEGGTVSVFDASANALQRVEDYHAPHAHSVAVDPVTHRVYLPLQDVRGRPVLRVLAAESER